MDFINQLKRRMTREVMASIHFKMNLEMEQATGKYLLHHQVPKFQKDQISKEKERKKQMSYLMAYLIEDPRMIKKKNKMKKRL
jgi:hypothetical protein